jgi:hypothetical protein
MLKHVSHVRLDFARESRPLEAERVGTNPGGIERQGLRAEKPVGKRLDGRFGHEDACHPLLDRFQRAATTQRDNGPSTGLSFDRHDPEVLFSRLQDRSSRPVQSAQFFALLHAKKFHVGARHPFEPGTFGAVPHNT